VKHNGACVAVQGCFCVEIVLYSDRSYSADAETLDGRTSRPGPVSISFEIIDAQVVRDGDEKYVVGRLNLVQICSRLF